MKTAVKQNTERLHLLGRLENVVDRIKTLKDIENYNGYDFERVFKQRIRLTSEQVSILRNLEMLIN